VYFSAISSLIAFAKILVFCLSSEQKICSNLHLKKGSFLYKTFSPKKQFIDDKIENITAEAIYLKIIDLC
jgi:hypothetical protein